VCKLRAVINLHGLYGLCSVLLRTSQMTVHVCSIALSRYIILQTFVAVIVHFCAEYATDSLAVIDNLNFYRTVYSYMHKLLQYFLR